MSGSYMDECGFTDQSDGRDTYKIFISHSSRDVDLVTAFVEMLEGIGIGHGKVFCSSVPGYGIPLGEDIYDYLREELIGKRVYVIFFLSDAYYESAACLNEMGAAWILRHDHLTILQPGFTFKEIKGAVNPRAIALDLNGECKDRLNDLFEKLKVMFRLNGVPLNRWEYHRERFLARL